MSENEPNNNHGNMKESVESLAKKTASATLDFLRNLDYEFEGKGAETAHSLKQNIKIVEENISLPGVFEKLQRAQKDLISETLKRLRIKLNYLEGKPQIVQPSEPPIEQKLEIPGLIRGFNDFKRKNSSGATNIYNNDDIYGEDWIIDNEKGTYVGPTTIKKKDGKSAPNSHDDFDEMVVVEDGVIEVAWKINGKIETKVLKKGEVINFPKGIVHDIRAKKENSKLYILVLEGYDENKIKWKENEKLFSNS